MEQESDEMSEAIAFIAGMVSMGIVWFINDNSPRTSPYRRGFEDGYRKAMKDYEEILKLNDCNTCRNKNCPYRPKWGERVRINCPLYIRGEEVTE